MRTACLKDKIEFKFFLAFIAGVSVQFRCKERGTRVKDRVKMAQVKPKTTFLGHSLLRNHREMLANVCRLSFFKPYNSDKVVEYY